MERVLVLVGNTMKILLLVLQSFFKICIGIGVGDDALLKCVVTEVVLLSFVAFKTLTFHKVV